MRQIKLSLVFLFWAALACARTETEVPFFKGVTVSAQTWGIEWSRPAMATTLDELKSLGANAIAIHPYAQIQEDGGIRFSAEAEPIHITKPLDWARDRNLEVMLIPHLAYWGTKFLWRGEIDFPTTQQWDRFFGDYETWIVMMAKIAERHGAGIFCIGLEYSLAEKYEERWRGIIASVRAVYHGKITYGANWNSFETVRFWDALDYIGVLAYFPLSTAPDPSPAELADGWKTWTEKLDALSRQQGKRILFTEIGYNESALCAAQPWAFQTGGPNAQLVQARCLEQALLLPKRWPNLAGEFFWKWFPDLPDPEPENFDLRKPAIKALISRHWGAK